MNNFLLVIGALLVGILAALVAVPMVIDWNSYRGVFEEEASRLLGRDVRVGGGVNLRILPVPYVRFEKLRIADTTSTGGDPLFRAESVTMQLSVAPLLKGVLEARSVELKRPLLRLAVDDEGRANWRSLTIQPGSLPFVPADVALQSVGIEDGTLVLAGSGTKNIAEINGIAGELSADSLDGPYRFKGTANWGGSPREIKATTAKPEADGAIHVRSSVRALATGTTTIFDGRLVDLKGQPRFDGDLTAKVRLGSAGATPKPAADDDPDAMDFKAKVTGNLKGGELKDIELSHDDPADPQLVTGQASASWENAVKVNLALSARSFNLDRLSGANRESRSGAVDAADPVQTARTALAVALGALPAEAETSATFKAERATLNGEALSGVSLSVERHGGDLEVRSLKAMLPGATRFLASGVLTRDPSKPSFVGPISLRANNLARFITWARKASAADAALLSRYDGPFALEGQLALTGSLLELTRATAELSGRSISGEIRYNTEARRRLGIVLDGDRIEAAQLWPGGFDPSALKAYLTGSVWAAGSGLYGFDPATTDLTLTVRAGELQMSPAWNLRAVDANLSVSGGKLTLSRLRFDTEDGLGVDADGSLAGLTPEPGKTTGTTPAPHGTVRWNLDAATPQAVAALVAAIDWPAANRPSVETIQAITALGPLHLSGSTVLGGRGPRALDITVDGMVDTGHFGAHARLDSGLQGWAAAPLDLTATVDTPDTSRWLALSGLHTPSPALSAPRPGRLVLNAIGSPRSGLASFAELRDDQNVLSANGKATVSEAGELTFDGTLAVSVRDVTDALALAGLGFGQGPSELPLSGSVRLARTPGSLVIETRGAKLGPAPVMASLSLTPDASKPGIRMLAADVTLDQVTVPALLASISERRAPQGSVPSAATSGRWPEQPIRLPQGLSGRINLKANRLVLDGAAAAGKLVAAIRLDPEAVIVDNLTAAALGGTIKASFALKPEAAALALDGVLSLSGANLSGLTPTASAPLSATVKLKGSGLSAAGIVASLSGSGEANLGSGEIKGVAPAGIAGVVDTALASKEPIVGDALSDTLRHSLADSHLTLKPVKVPFAIAYGVARTEKLAVAAPEGRTSLDASLDLNALKFALDWRIEAASKPSLSGAIKPALSPLQFSVQGPLSALPGAETSLSLGSFEQELVVRRMEHDAEELARLRKADEERRRAEEAERIKREEAERQKAAEAAAAAKSQAGSPPGAGMPDAAPANDPPASLQPADPPPPGAAPQAAAPVPAPPPAPALRRRPPAAPQASGIPQPFGNNY